MKKKKTSSSRPEDHDPVREFLNRGYLNRYHDVFVAGNECGLYDAICYCREHAAALPKWALDVIRIRQHELMFGGKNKNKRHDEWRRRFEDDMADRARFETVEQCLEHGVQEKVVYDVASRALAGSAAAGTPSTMREAYRRFVKRQKENPLRYYIPHYLPVELRNLHKFPMTVPGKGTLFQFRDDARFSRRKPVDPRLTGRELCPPWDPKLLE